MDEAVRSSIVERVSGENYAEKLGMKLVRLSDGYAMVEMIPQDGDTNIFGMVHGGAIFSLVDEAFQVSCNSHGTVAVALSMSVVYHHPPKTGDKLVAESKEVHLSRKTATYEITVTDENDTLIASCKALAYRKQDPLPFLKNPC